MASIVYTALLFVFIFGAALTYINDTGMYGYQLPDSGVRSNIEQANQTGHALQSEAEHPTALSSWNQMGTMMHAVWGGVVALFTLNYLLEAFGIPVGLAGFLLSPLAIVIVFWLAEYWFGRPAE